MNTKAINYTSVFWSIGGFKTQEEAAAGLQALISLFEKNHNPMEWSYTTSVMQTPYGFKAEFSGTKMQESSIG